MSVRKYEMTWPITDPTRPLPELHAEAVESLRITAHTHGWEYLTGPHLPVVRLHHGRHGKPATITAVVHVRLFPAEEQVAA